MGACSQLAVHDEKLADVKLPQNLTEALECDSQSMSVQLIWYIFKEYGMCVLIISCLGLLCLFVVLEVLHVWLLNSTSRCV